MRSKRGAITIAAFLAVAVIMFPVTIFAQEPTATETPGNITAQDAVQMTNCILYHKTGSGNVLLVRSAQETMLACFGTDSDGLGAWLAEEGVTHINSLILASAEGQEAVLGELDGITVDHLYTAGNDTAVSAASGQGIDTTYAEYLSVGTESILLYPDDKKDLGILVFDASNSLFAADAIDDMSFLRGHSEIARISLLSISPETNLDQEVLSIMNPDTCLIVGDDMPDARTLSAFYGLGVAQTEKFFRAGDVTSIDPSEYTTLQGAQPVYLEIQDPLFFISEDTQEKEAERVLVQSALRIARGEFGTGQARIDNLRREGYTDSEIDQMQSIVDYIYKNHLSTCVAVFFDTGGYTVSPDYQLVTVGKTAQRPDDPEKIGMEFLGWYTDKACKIPFDFTAPLDSTMTLYAGWRGAEQTLKMQPETEPPAQQETVQEPETQAMPEPITIQETETEMDVQQAVSSMPEPQTKLETQAQQDKNRELFYLWTFLSKEGLMDDARAYLDDYMGIPSPFEQ